MAKKNQYDPSTIRGISIYKDDKRTVYAPFYSKNAYILTPGNTKHYVNYVVGYLAAMVAFEFALIFFKDIKISIIIGLLVLVVNYLFFYFNFLKRAAVVENYSKAKKENFIVRQAKQLEYDRIYTLIVCCILLVVIFFFYSKWQKLEGIYYYIILFSMLASALYGFINLAILIYKRRNDL